MKGKKSARSAKEQDKPKKEKCCKGHKESTLRASKAIPDKVATVVDAYVASHTKVDVLREKYIQLQKITVEGKKQEKLKERSRCPEIPCVEETRFILEEPNGSNFIHANKVCFENVCREYIVAQAPIENTVEDFWRMVFQAQSAAVVVVCKFYEDGKESSQQFWPQETGLYKYYGKMFLNNKKTEFTPDGNIFTIEVLPDGCSNSLITKVYHCPTWQPNSTPSPRTVLRFMRSVKNDCGPLTVVSSEGVGRACVYVTVDVVTTRLFKGLETKFVDIAISLRKQRALAFKAELFYLTAAHCIMEYIRAKIPKHETAVAVMKAGIANI